MNLESRTYTGIHATDEKGKIGIISEAKIRGAEVTWLGQGAYFYEEGDTLPEYIHLDGLEVAKEYKPKNIKKGLEDKTFLFKAELCLNKNLNLVDNKKHQEIYQKSYQILKKTCEDNNQAIPGELPRMVIKGLKKKLNFTSVRAIVISRRYGYIRFPEAIELCVSESNEVSNIIKICEVKHG